MFWPWTPSLVAECFAFCGDYPGFRMFQGFRATKWGASLHTWNSNAIMMPFLIISDWMQVAFLGIKKRWECATPRHIHRSSIHHRVWSHHGHWTSPVELWDQSILCPPRHQLSAILRHRIIARLSVVPWRSGNVRKCMCLYAFLICFWYVVDILKIDLDILQLLQ